MTYKIGETYWGPNPKATNTYGKKMQSSGVLIGWTNDNKAILENKRWGQFTVTTNDLDIYN